MAEGNKLPFRMGDTGTTVKAIQAKLRSFYKPGMELASPYYIDVDGIFGPQTHEAVMFYQLEHGLDTDGIVGELTFDSLYPKPVWAPPKRGKVILQSLKEIIDRANNCVGAPIKYHLEYPNGGTDPEAIMPCDEQTAGLDCSGFNAWVQGFDRLLKGFSKTIDKWGGYVNTDSKIAEAEAEGLLFTVHATPEVGDLIVGESFRPSLALALYRKIGHEGTIVGVHDFATLGLAGLAVVHCSPSNVKLNKDGSAVWKTSGKLWGAYKKVRFLRYNREYAAKRAAAMS